MRLKCEVETCSYSSGLLNGPSSLNHPLRGCVMDTWWLGKGHMIMVECN